MIPSASVVLITERSASKIVSTKMMRTPRSLYGRASFTPPTWPASPCAPTNTPRDDLGGVGRAGAEDVVVGARFHVMNGARRDAKCLARLQLHVARRVAPVQLHAIPDLTGEQVDGLVLLHVILHRKLLAGIDVENLPRVELVRRPDGLVAPGLRNVANLRASAHRCLTASHHPPSQRRETFLDGAIQHRIADVNDHTAHDGRIHREVWDDLLSEHSREPCG